MADGQVVIEITADNRDVKQTLRDTTNELHHAGQQWEKQGDAMSGIFKKIAGAITAAGIGKALLNIGRDAIQAASSLQEVQNVVDVTFGSASSEIDRWAKNAIAQFGLTETQAKQFASTIGAMMKSSGVAGDEIVGMSEDLAGLAADMASFYNLDFETAFQKIRSGISGETEPLKQLGINMSVVNLEAFAMTQGITKSFSEMSQGEQVMLRYQYLMQATADAQGDFSRTSDGFANATRLLQSNVDQLLTTVGGPLTSAAAGVLSTINNIITSLSPIERQRTIVDDFADIVAEREGDLAEVRATADAARELLGILQGLNEGGYSVDAVARFAESANKLDSSSPYNWEEILTTFRDNTPGDMAWLQNSDSVKAMATALAGLDGSTSRADAWREMLSALSENADGIAQMMGVSPDTVRSMLSGIADQAGRIDEGDAQAWDDLFTVFATSFPGLVTSTTLSAMGVSIGGIATSANQLRASSSGNWQHFLEAVQGIDGLSNIWGGEVGGLTALADALANSGITTGRAAAWQTMLDALGQNLGAVAELHGDTENNTAAWLETLAVSANQLNPASAEGWDTLFSWLVEGLPGLSDTEEGQALLAALQQGPQSEVRNASQDAVEVMDMLGISTENVNNQQELWLATCRQLVQLIPSLSRIINTETGEILGGAQAVRDYIDAWETDNVRRIYINALREMQTQLQAQMHASRTESIGRRAVFRTTVPGITDDALDTLEGIMTGFADAGFTAESVISHMDAGINTWAQVFGDASAEMRVMADARRHLTDRQREAFDEWLTAVMNERYLETTTPVALDLYQDAIDEIEQQGIDAAEALAEATEDVGDAVDSTAAAVRELSDDQRTAWNEAIADIVAASRAVDQYRQHMVEATQSTLRSWGNLFDAIETRDEQTLREINESLEDFEGDRDVEFEVRVGTSSIRSAANMLTALQSRIARLQHYNELMAQAADLGYSDTVLAQLADGSLESYDMLSALVSGGEGYVDQINDAYARVEATEAELADTLAGYRLQTDEEFQSLLDTLGGAMNTLDSMVPTDEPALAVGATMTAVINTIGEMYPGLRDAVNSVLREIERLTEVNIGGGGINIMGGHAPGLGGFSFVFGVNGSHAGGLDYVPFDGYLAQLHRGETVLTAQEAQIWREFHNGLNADTLAGAIWDNSPDMGGNVYLNGEIVGRIMSGVQADSYRQLERSGWRG